jgi:diadenosine tetraphosphate (Ap4A) HIT family hydrolase
MRRGVLINNVIVVGAAAAQVVPHVHFHIIPRPDLTPELRNKSFTMFGRGQWSELDEGEAAELAIKVRDELARELTSGRL